MSSQSSSTTMTGPHLRARQAAAFLSIATSTYWRWVSEGRLPKGVRLGMRCTVWRKADLEAFVAEREQASET